MPVSTESIKFATQGDGEIVDITDAVGDAVRSSSVTNGIVTVFIPGSTAALTTIEYEEGVTKDLQAAIERMAPGDIPYAHDQKWHDGNGHSHVRSAMLGPDITIPFTNKKLRLGTWQQIVLIDFDNRPRNRQLICQIIGE